MKTPKGTELPLLDLRGKPYLQVQWRIVWFREECPKHTIETDFVSVNDTSAFARAVVKDESGRVLAVAHKFEDQQGFPDFREKAETGAIGRALAMIGFGTQFCVGDFDEGPRVVDSPPARPPAPQGQRPVIKSGAPATIPCVCGAQMLISQYNANEFYCKACKSKRPRLA